MNYISYICYKVKQRIGGVFKNKKKNGEHLAMKIVLIPESH